MKESQFPGFDACMRMMVSLRRRGGASDFLPIPRRRKDANHHGKFRIMEAIRDQLKRNLMN